MASLINATPLRIEPPDPNSVTPADAYTANKAAIASWLADQQAKSAAMGLADQETGLPTRAGLINAAQQYGSGMLMGSASPGSRGATLDNPAFAKWFGQSKVVDEAGAPMVVYHQTAVDRVPAIHEQGFSTDPSVARARLSDDQVPNGIFFKPHPNDIGVGTADKDKISQVQAHLSLQNPLVVNDRDALAGFLTKASPEYAQHAADMKAIDKKYNKMFDTVWNSDALRDRYNDAGQAELDRIVNEWTSATAAKAGIMRSVVDDVLRQKGHDGLIINNDAGGFNRKTKTYIALEPTQIKSPDNRGTFNPTDPRITYGAAGLTAGGAAATQGSE